MPVICTKEKNKFEIITGRVLEKRRADSRISNQTLRTFSVKNPPTSTNSKFLIGTPVPNSTAKGIINWKDTLNTTIVRGNKELVIPESVHNKIELRKSELKKTIIREENNVDDNKRRSHKKSSSFISGDEKLKELQELQKELQKNYEPKPLFAPRRPTLETIKSAIEKAKQENERNKNVGTDDIDYKSAITMSDASTSTEKLGKKICKKKKASKEMHISPDTSSTMNEIKTKNSKKTSSSTKANKKTDKSLQRK